LDIVKRAAFSAALFIFGTALPVFAQDVTLTSRDKSVEVSGNLLGFDGEFYRVETEYGELTIDGSGVDCAGPGCPNLTAFVAELDISGASEVGRLLLPALIEAFAAQNELKTERVNETDDAFSITMSQKSDGETLARFFIHISSSGEGFADLLADQTDIVMSTREISPKERQLARAAGMGDLTQRGRARVLALDALVAIVSNQNPVNEISVLQLSQIYSGKLNNWKTLGPQDAEITPYLRDLETGSGAVALQRLSLKEAETTTTHFSPDNLDLATRVSIDPFGIGLVGRSATLDNKILTLTGTCDRSLRPTRRNVKTEDYPLTTPLFLYLPARRLPKIAREFLSYTRSPAAQLVIRRAGFVDQAPEEISLDFQGDRLANAISIAGNEVAVKDVQDMVGELRKMQRLTTSFRFETGSVRLDAQSRSNVEQLASALEAGIYDGKSLVFVGFSDGEGAAEANLEISQRRANVVKAAVEKAAETADLRQLEVSVQAYGEAMPMACDDTEWGRQVNRRVEVWIR
jgi:phosphate transport system substrate-binding protein